MTRSAAAARPAGTAWDSEGSLKSGWSLLSLFPAAQALCEVHEGRIILIAETERPARRATFPSLRLAVPLRDPFALLLAHGLVWDS